MEEQSLIKWHGKVGAQNNWELPILTTYCDDKSRPGYTEIAAHEYRDTEEVLLQKIKVLAEMIRHSECCVAYTGAGLSVSSGLADYATKAQETIEANPHISEERGSGFLAYPNTGHKVLAQLHSNGFVKKVINQNHDGLLQKAGLPQYACNEIHGAWYDPSNPGEFILRDDLFDDLLQWEKKVDLCLALGTSLSGLNADRIAVTPAKNFSKDKGFGLVIVTLQETQLDDICSLRIFAPLDDVMRQLSIELDLAEIPEKDPLDTSDIFTIPYDIDTGALSRSKTFNLNLKVGTKIKVTLGNFKNCKGTVVGKNEQGNYQLQIYVPVEGMEDVIIPYDHLLGSWFVQEALEGLLPYIPVISE